LRNYWINNEPVSVLDIWDHFVDIFGEAYGREKMNKDLMGGDNKRLTGTGKIGEALLAH
jgi:hypothetical protein